MMRMTRILGTKADATPVTPDQQERIQAVVQMAHRLAEMGIGLADVRQSFVDRIAELPIEATWLGFEHPLADLDRLALQIDTLYTELLQLLAEPEERPD
jgi:hypothetical protein